MEEYAKDIKDFPKQQTKTFVEIILEREQKPTEDWQIEAYIHNVDKRKYV